LIILRQTLLSLGGAVAPESESVPAAAAAQQPQRPAQISPDVSAADPTLEPQIAASLAPSLISEIDCGGNFLPQARLPAADDVSESNGSSRIFSALPPQSDAGTRPATTGATLNLLQEVLQGHPAKSRQRSKAGPQRRRTTRSTATGK